MCAEPWQNSRNAQNIPRYYLFAPFETWISRARDACSRKALGWVSALPLIIFSLLTLEEEENQLGSDRTAQSGWRLALCYRCCKGEKFSRGKILQKTPPQHGFGGGNYRHYTCNSREKRSTENKPNRWKCSNKLSVKWCFSVVCCWRCRPLIKEDSCRRMTATAANNNAALSLWSVSNDPHLTEGCVLVIGYKT